MLKLADHAVCAFIAGPAEFLALGKYQVPVAPRRRFRDACREYRPPNLPPFYLLKLASFPTDGDDDDTPTGEFTCDGVEKGDFCCSVGLSRSRDPA